MKEVLGILGETLLIATFQRRRSPPSAIGFDEMQIEGPTRLRPERAADCKRIY